MIVSILVVAAGCSTSGDGGDGHDDLANDAADESTQAVTSSDSFTGFASFNIYDGVPATSVFCNLDPAQFGLIVTALRTDLANAYAAAHGRSACGLCARVTSNGKTVVAHIIDHSNDFTNNGGKRYLDLSRQAFQRIGNPDSGFIPVSFTIEACP
jgi:expansin (peptidoglycan-binding protein)